MRQRLVALIWILLCSFGAADGVLAQSSLNVTLFGQLDPVPIRYSGCFGWTAPGGQEYALLGCHTGTSIITIDSQLALLEVAFIPGPASNWREITVIDDHAFVVSEGAGAGAGMQVISLAGLPATASLVTTYTSTFTTAHIIQRDVQSPEPYVYVAGTSSTGGVHILDVSNPAVPVEVGVYAPDYVHDVHVRGSWLYAALVWAGRLEIVDITDRTSPSLRTTIVYPSAFTHSSWTTADETHLMICDETDGLPARMWNIEDVDNPVPVAEYTANPASLVHNPYTRGDLIFITHNTEGLRVVDAADPSVLVEVGYYDTYAGPSGGFNGLWSAYPFFPSGKIIGGNREDGLYVWEFNGTRAGRIYGTVTDADSSTPIAGATVSITAASATATSESDGTYKIGALPSGAPGYDVVVTAPGYLELQDVVILNGGDALTRDYQLVPDVIAVDDGPAAVPTSTSLGQNVPNPFNPSTRIEYVVDVHARVQLRVVDAVGRHVVTLADAVQEAGAHAVTWDGRDALGRPVASGAYFYSLRVDGETTTRQMLLVR